LNARETAAVMDILRVAYPQFYRGVDSRDIALAVQLWTEMFAQDEVKTVLAAVKRLIALDTRGFPPAIGAVKEQVWRLTHPQELDAAGAWALVAKAVNSPDYEAAFAALPEEVRQAVGSPAQLAQWGRMEESAFQSVAASNFQKNYRERLNRRKEKAVAACLGRGGATAELRGEEAPGEKILLEGGEQA
jgi:hypothetical protein